MTRKLTDRQLQSISRVLSDPRRFAILKRVASADCLSCSNMREAFPISAATLSHHLKELEHSGLIKLDRRGKFVDATFCREIWEAYLARLREV